MRHALLLCVLCAGCGARPLLVPEPRIGYAADAPVGPVQPVEWRLWITPVCACWPCDAPGCSSSRPERLIDVAATDVTCGLPRAAAQEEVMPIDDSSMHLSRAGDNQHVPGASVTERPRENAKETGAAALSSTSLTDLRADRASDPTMAFWGDCSLPVDVSSLPAGAYYFQLTTSGARPSPMEHVSPVFWRGPITKPISPTDVEMVP